MTAGDEYRVKAVKFHARAQTENDPNTRSELENLARAYLLLAQQAERNTHIDVVYETPPSKDGEVKQSD